MVRLLKESVGTFDLMVEKEGEREGGEMKEEGEIEIKEGATNTREGRRAGGRE